VSEVGWIRRLLRGVANRRVLRGARELGFCSGAMRMFTMIRVREGDALVTGQIFCGCTEKARGAARLELPSFLSR
jgi:hypothetical protein